MSHDEELRRYLSIIAAYAPPSRVLLFGSRARSGGTAASDFDLCVIYDRMPKRRLEVLQDLYRLLFSVTGNPVDVVVYEADRFQKRAARSGTFEATIAGEGQVVYGST